MSFWDDELDLASFNKMDKSEDFDFVLNIEPIEREKTDTIGNTDVNKSLDELYKYFLIANLIMESYKTFWDIPQKSNIRPCFNNGLYTIIYNGFLSPQNRIITSIDFKDKNQQTLKILKKDHYLESYSVNNSTFDTNLGIIDYVINIKQVKKNALLINKSYRAYIKLLKDISIENSKENRSTNKQSYYSLNEMIYFYLPKKSKKNCIGMKKLFNEIKSKTGLPIYELQQKPFNIGMLTKCLEILKQKDLINYILRPDNTIFYTFDSNVRL